MHGSYTEFALCSYSDTNLFYGGGKNIAVSANFLNFPLQMQHLDGAGQFWVLVPCRLSNIALMFKKVKFALTAMFLPPQ